MIRRRGCYLYKQILFHQRLGEDVAEVLVEW